MTLQIDIDGREVPIARTRPAKLSPAQREILRTLYRDGSIRAVYAGRLVHAFRVGEAQDVHRFYEWTGDGRRGLGCCKYASADGSDALRRLLKRGLVSHPARGRWEPL